MRRQAERRPEAAAGTIVAASTARWPSLAMELAAIQRKAGNRAVAHALTTSVQRAPVPPIAAHNVKMASAPVVQRDSRKSKSKKRDLSGQDLSLDPPLEFR